jgi:membrane-associated phospholipid phosphatase
MPLEGERPMTRSLASEPGLIRPTAFWGAAFLVCLLAFAAIGWLVSQPGIPPIDTTVTTILHGFASPTLDAVMAALTNLGSTVVLAAVVGCAAVVLVARRRPAEAAFLVVALVGSLLLNDVLKSMFHRPRPGFDWAVLPPETGFPSGHSMNSFVVYVAIALVIWRRGGRRAGIPALAVAIVLALCVGTSRIYLGAHWLSDVIGAYLAGALWLMVLVAAWALGSRLSGRGHAEPGPGDRGGRSVRSRPTV